MELFLEIKNSQEIKNLFKEVLVKEKEEANFWAFHGETHIMNVVNFVERVSKLLNYDEEFVMQTKIAALLHDFGMIYGKEGHAEKSYEIAKKYFEENNIQTGNNEMILDAILNHSDGFGRNNKIAAILMFADKIDVKKDRIAPMGYDIPGMREVQYIEDIAINIINNELTINFIVKEEANKQEIEEFYFFEKIFKSIKAFAKENNLTYLVYYNDENWHLANNI